MVPEPTHEAQARATGGRRRGRFGRRLHRRRQEDAVVDVGRRPPDRRRPPGLDERRRRPVRHRPGGLRRGGPSPVDGTAALPQLISSSPVFFSSVIVISICSFCVVAALDAAETLKKMPVLLLLRLHWRVGVALCLLFVLFTNPRKCVSKKK